MNSSHRNSLLRNIPSVDEVLNCHQVKELYPAYSRDTVRYAVQHILQNRRDRLLRQKHADKIDIDEIKSVPSDLIVSFICKMKELSLKRVINASGIIIHTNIGRAPLSDEAINAVVKAAKYYTNLEFDLSTGNRGKRYSHVTGLLQKITHAESGLVVNNNAAAVLLCLSTFAKGYEVIISRGELIEIGGSFRIPEIMAQSGATLVEVGSTNRTHPDDYINAINQNTRLILKVHTSNYRVVGFTSEVSLTKLSEITAKHQLPLLYDMGSGNFMPAQMLGLKNEPTVQEVISSGADLLTFSGDKLLAGPQSGIIVGKKQFIDCLERNPLTRALRVDKMTLAALEATLKAYAPGLQNPDSLPVLQMLMTPPDELKAHAEKLSANLIQKCPSIKLEILKDASQVGGGAYPLHDLPTYTVVIDPAPLTASQFAQQMRNLEIPIIARIKNDRILLDVRTLRHDDMQLIPELFTALI